MAKWYNKSIYIITEKNFVSFLLLLLTIVVYAVEEMSGGEMVYTQFMLGLTLGQKIGSAVEEIRRNTWE